MFADILIEQHFMESFHGQFANKQNKMSKQLPDCRCNLNVNQGKFRRFFHFIQQYLCGHICPITGMLKYCGDVIFINELDGQRPDDTLVRPSTGSGQNKSQIDDNHKQNKKKLLKGSYFNNN